MKSQMIMIQLFFFDEIPDYRERYLLKSEDWKFDPIPEIMNGMNVADYVDPDIMSKLEELEREEEQRLLELESRMEEIDYEPLTEEEKLYYKAISKKKELMMARHDFEKTIRMNNPVVPRTKKALAKERTFEDMQADLRGSGKEPERALKRARSASRSRSVSRVAESDAKKQRIASKSRERSISKEPKPGEGFKDLKQKVFAEIKARRAIRDRNAASKKGEGDRVIVNLKPKHLYTGKRGIGKANHR